jgi:lipoprotein-anchoring transpeptidase ErfK/SrfK
MNQFLSVVLVVVSFLSLPNLNSQAATVADEMNSVDFNAIFEADDLSNILTTDTLTDDEKYLTAKPEDYIRAKVVAVINKSKTGSTAQTLRIYIDGQLTHTFKTSTGREKVETAKSGRVYKTTTPVGYFRPTQLEKLHRSITWDADMPNAVFFNGGIAVHATAKSHYKELGTRASGGCARLTLDNSKLFFDLVKLTGTKLVPLIKRDGTDALKADGTQIMTSGYDVLIIVENTI